jgi:hypothetical protein
MNTTTSVFSKSQFEYHFIKYIAVWGAVITVTLLEVYWLYKKFPQDIKTIISVVLVFVFIHFCTALLSRKFIFRIIANIDQKQFTLQLFNKNEIEVSY